jgi:hypothetical protein
MLSLENKLAPCAGKTVNPLNIVGQYIMSPFHLPAFYYKKKKSNIDNSIYLIWASKQCVAQSDQHIYTNSYAEG